jgi:galactokinase
VSAPDRVAAFAPGRVNLIGEHTDYNDGLCLPFAIELGVTVRAEPLRRAAIEARALDFGEEDRFALDERSPAAGWRALVRGAAAELRAEGIELRPARLEIAGDVPLGAGLSSSAALCVALCIALCAVAGAPQPGGVELARICSRVENEWVGARTGLLDQLASLFGVADHALLLDCATNEVTPARLPPADEAEFVVIDGGERSLAASGYRDRVEECRRAEAEIGPLRTAALDDVDKIGDPVLRRRARHVVTENRRVHDFVAAVGAGDIDVAGALMDDSHRSLSEDFESSAPAIDDLQRDVRAASVVLGARITGGGWGGAIVALTRPGALADQGWVVRAVGGASVEIREPR